MKKLTGLIIAFLMPLSCLGGNADTSGDPAMDKFIDNLMSRMTLREKLGQMNLPTGGDLTTGSVRNTALETLIDNGELGGFFNVKGAEKIRDFQRRAVENSRLGIPLIVGADVIHGYETIFPIPLALSCSWNPEAVKKMSQISAKEASAAGIGWTFSPMVDICRDARWGRIAEGNGEDPYLGSVMAKAYVDGYQGKDMNSADNILACVKHFALYGASESGRDYNTVDMSRQTMYNFYLPPYKAAVDAGVGSVMSSFNVVDYVPATANKWLLSDLLRDQWGFNGFVVTDYNSINEMAVHGHSNLEKASARALLAGTDMDMVSEGFLSTLEKSLDEGKVTMADIDRACRRILEAKYKLGLFKDPYKYCRPEREMTDVYNEENRKAAREIAAETFVLLKNSDDILPLSPKSKIALIGPMADAGNNMRGTWSMTCSRDNHKSLVEAMREVAGKENVLYAQGSNLYLDAKTQKGAEYNRKIKRGDNRELLSEAMRVAKDADVIVVALGESAEMSGESSSRTSLTLPDAQRILLDSLLTLHKPVAMILFAGRPLVLTKEDKDLDAILNVWYGGSEAADAIADVVYGKKVPSGKLTVSFPRSEGQLPLYYNHLNTGRPDPDDSRFNQYWSNYIDCANTPLYPFGYGLSYTTFEYGKPSMSSNELKEGETLTITVPVTNTGRRNAEESVQLYIRDLFSEGVRPVKELKGFKKVAVDAGKTTNVAFNITTDDLKYYNPELQYVCEPGEFEIMVGSSSDNIQKIKFNVK